MIPINSRLKSLLVSLLDSPIIVRIARGALWNMLGAIVFRSLSIISFIIAARLVGAKGFGELGVVLDTVTMFQMFAALGLGLTATKYVAELKDHDPKRAGSIIGLSKAIALSTGLVCSISLIIFSPWLCSSVLAAPGLVETFRLASLLLFFGSLNGYQNGVLTGLEAFKAMALINIIIGIVSLPLIVVFILWWGIKGAVFGLTVSVALNWLLNTMTIRYELHKAGITINNTLECFKERSTLWNFSLPAALSGFMVTPAIWACDAILVNTPNGYHEMGVFNAANQWRVAILFLPNVISTAILPLLSNLFGINNRTTYNTVIKYNILSSTSITLAGSFIVIVLSPIIVSFYGNDFLHTHMVFIILSLSTILTSLNTAIGQAIVSSGNVWYGFMFNLLWAVSIVCFAFILVPQRGAQGLALAFLGSYILHSVWQGFYLIKVLYVPSRTIAQ